MADNKKMKILLTNDDGIFAPGLFAIYKELIKIGDVTVVAPADSQSGTSHSVTFFQPLICNKISINDQFTGYSVQGSPADCVKLACLQLHPEPIDLLISGINNGANAGINVFYSGTVAAAIEASFLKVPAVAMSLSGDQQMDFETAAKYCIKTLKKLMPVKTGDVLNINIPKLSRGRPKGIKIVPHSDKGFDEYYVRQKSDLGQMVFQLAGSPHLVDESPTDTTALMDGFITVTALASDMTDHKKTQQLQKIELDSLQSPQA